MKRLSGYGFLLLGIFSCLLAIRELAEGYSSGMYLHSYPKGGITFIGIPAVVILGVWFAVGIAFTILGLNRISCK